jgi:hypothetical protein
MIKFTAENHSDEDVPLLETLRHAINQKSYSGETMDSIYKSVDRTIKMFYLSQQMQGNLKEFKEDYFIN